MQQDFQFYTSQKKASCHLHFIASEQWEAWLAAQPAFWQNQLKAQAFAGKAGEVALVMDEQGHLVQACLGMQAGLANRSLAAAAMKLPAGVYALAEALPLPDKLGWALGQYVFDRYKKNGAAAVKQLVVNEAERSTLEAYTEAVFLARDLINTPASDMGPAQLADAAKQLARLHGADFEEWVGDELLAAGFPAIHAVGRAAAQAPRLISLRWGNPKHPRVSLIGKGVCFDSGGLDLKPSSAMRLMKKDMGGAAQALAAGSWLMRQKLPVYLNILIPAVENAVGPAAFRPGDILTMRNGLTVEVDNTDAEGRLVLADALTKAMEDKPDLIIDFATLTGAARVAVGTELSALFSNEDQLAADLTAAGLRMRDPLWRLPLYEPYEELFQSTVADIANASGSPYAGAITAALFLQRFVPKGTPWAHFDLMAWNVAAKPGKPEGGEAMAVLAVCDYLHHKITANADGSVVG